MKLNLSKRIALLIGCLILAVSLSLTIIGTRLSSKAILEQTEEALLMSADDGARLFEATIDRDLSILQELANRERTQTMDWNIQQRSLLSDVARLGFLDIGIVLPNGTTRYVSDGSTADLGDRDYIKKALQGEANISELLISKVTNQPVFMFATPIKANDKVVGVLIGRKDGSTLSEITDTMGSGENGYAFILGQDGTLYAHRDRGLVLEQVNIFVEEDMEDVGRAINELGIGNKGKIDYSYLGSKRIMGIGSIPSTGWIIAVGAHESDVLAGLNQLKTSLVIWTIIFIILGIIFATYLGKSISRPISEYSRVIEQFANYDLKLDGDSKVFKYTNRKDEVGNIGNSLVIMQKNLVQLIERVSDISQQVASSSEELNATTEQSSVAAEEVARAIEDIASGASEQARDTENGAVNVDRLGHLIETIKDDVNNLSNAADKINIIKDEGLDIITELVEKTNESKEASGEIYKLILNTNESAGRIERASEMIKSIANQTNLLALNAAIEAARAGEAGRGFSVVADEIRKLAEESSKFTEEIFNIIRELIEKTETTVKTMDQVKTTIESQSISVDMTNDKFEGIAEAIEDIRGLINIIIESDEQMEIKKDEVIQVIQNLSAISEENAAGSEEASASVEEQTASMGEIANASESLAQLANEMLESITRFKY